MSLDNLFGGNPIQRIDAIILEIFQKEMDAIEAEGGIEDAIRKEKATIIEDIFRGSKIAQLYDKRFFTELQEPAAYFDKLYELDLPTLEAYNKAIDRLNTKYMRKEVEKHNNGWDHLDMR
jgi:hypothetical protein